MYKNTHRIQVDTVEQGFQNNNQAILQDRCWYTCIAVTGKGGRGGDASTHNACTYQYVDKYLFGH